MAPPQSEQVQLPRYICRWKPPLSLSSAILLCELNYVTFYFDPKQNGKARQFDYESTYVPHSIKETGDRRKGLPPPGRFLRRRPERRGSPPRGLISSLGDGGGRTGERGREQTRAKVHGVNPFRFFGPRGSSLFADAETAEWSVSPIRQERSSFGERKSVKTQHHYHHYITEKKINRKVIHTPHISLVRFMWGIERRI